MNLKQNNMRIKSSIIGLTMLLAASVFVSCSNCPDIDIRYTFTDGTDTTVTVQATPYSSGVDKGRDCYRIAFQKEDLVNVASVEIIPEFGRAKVGDEGYFLNAEGLLTKFLERKEDCMYRTEYNDLGLAGYKNSCEAWVAILKSLDLECREYTKYENGEYTMSLKYDIEHCGVYEPLIVDFYRLKDSDANYSGMARKFRLISCQLLLGREQRRMRFSDMRSKHLKSESDKHGNRHLLQYLIRHWRQNRRCMQP